MTHVAALAIGIVVLLAGPAYWALAKWLAKAVADELSSRLGSAARVLLALVARIIPADQRDERLDEWLYDIDDIDLVYAERTITRHAVGIFYTLANIHGALSLRRELALIKTPVPVPATNTSKNEHFSIVGVVTLLAQKLLAALLNLIGMLVLTAVWGALVLPIMWIQLCAYFGLPPLSFFVLWIAGFVLGDRLLDWVGDFHFHLAER